ncbi:MAG: hypothetical protein ACT4UQ_12615 [Gammaproteobacteria bacterium]
MEADTYVGRWTIIIRDPELQGQKMPAWKAALPPGASFYIARNAAGEYWYLPGPEPKAPMDKSRRLSPSPDEHAKFEVGTLLPGTMYTDLAVDGGKLYFSINLINGSCCIINLGQSHGGLHGVSG